MPGAFGEVGHAPAQDPAYRPTGLAATLVVSPSLCLGALAYRSSKGGIAMI